MGITCIMDYELDYVVVQRGLFTCKKASSLCQKYQKIKTELCRNYQTSGYCQYGLRCQYAHGSAELQRKRVIQDNFKQRACLNFFRNSYCPYGHKCQYLHSDIIYKDSMRNTLYNIFRNKNISLARINKQTLYSLKIDNINKVKRSMKSNTKRLPFFQSMAGSQ